MIPIIGTLGSGLDMSRVHLVRSRMQLACDAFVFAGRRAMVGLSWTNNDDALASRFYHMNFPDGASGMQNVNLRYSASGTG
jgi:hypothetical protein